MLTIPLEPLTVRLALYVSRARRDKMKGIRVDAVSLGLGSSIGADELLPCLVTLVDDLDGVLLGLSLSGESKDVLEKLACAGEGEEGARCAHSPLAFHRGFCRFGTTRW